MSSKLNSLQYLAVCAGAAVLVNFVAAWQRASAWSQAAVTAIEFFPSPVFAGKLMGYLTNTFPKMGAVHAALINLAATWFAASLAHVIPVFLEQLNAQTSWHVGQWRLERFGVIVQNTLGFGLGIAWNVFLGNLLGPRSNEGEEMGLFRLTGLVGYLAVVTLLSFRLAAANTARGDNTTIVDRQWNLLEFAAYVVNAFTLVTFVNALLDPSWIGHFVGLCILWILSAIMSALVERADLEGTPSIATDTGTHSECQSRQRPYLFIFGPLLLVPCVWCCCPWLPVLWLLAGTTDDLSYVKERWYKLVSMVAGLAAAIETSGILTDVTNTLAESFCSVKQCNYPWLFVALQTFMAVIFSLALIPAISQLSSTTTISISDEGTTLPNSSATAEAAQGNHCRNVENQSGERTPFLKKFIGQIRGSGKGIEV